MNKRRKKKKKTTKTNERNVDKRAKLYECKKNGEKKLQ